MFYPFGGNKKELQFAVLSLLTKSSFKAGQRVFCSIKYEAGFIFLSVPNGRFPQEQLKLFQQQHADCGARDSSCFRRIRRLLALKTSHIFKICMCHVIEARQNEPRPNGGDFFT